MWITTFFVSLVRPDDGRLFGWGSNIEGQLGLVNANYSTTPVLIASNVARVACGYYHSAFITGSFHWVTTSICWFLFLYILFVRIHAFRPFNVLDRGWLDVQIIVSFRPPTLWRSRFRFFPLPCVQFNLAGVRSMNVAVLHSDHICMLLVLSSICDIFIGTKITTSKNSLGSAVEFTVGNEEEIVVNYWRQYLPTTR
jgi:hypothetical protein